MSKKQTIIVLVTAPSGAGKTTICNRLMATFSNMRRSISCTTRTPRVGEVEGKDYRFLTRNQFQNQIDAGKFIEWAEVYENLYGTLESELRAARQSGHMILIDVDTQGADKIRKWQSENSEQFRLLDIFILPPSLEELERRLLVRGTDSEEVIRKRLAEAKAEMAQAEKFSRRVTNEDLNKALDECQTFISSVQIQTVS